MSLLCVKLTNEIKTKEKLSKIFLLYFYANGHAAMLCTANTLVFLLIPAFMMNSLFLAAHKLILNACIASDSRSLTNYFTTSFLI